MKFFANFTYPSRSNAEKQAFILLRMFVLYSNTSTLESPGVWIKHETILVMLLSVMVPTTKWY